MSTESNKKKRSRPRTRSKKELTNDEVHKMIDELIETSYRKILKDGPDQRDCTVNMFDRMVRLRRKLRLAKYGKS